MRAHTELWESLRGGGLNCPCLFAKPGLDAWVHMMRGHMQVSAAQTAGASAPLDLVTGGHRYLELSKSVMADLPTKMASCRCGPLALRPACLCQ